MSPELVSILVLIAMFVAATVLPVNMGVLAFVAAFVVGTVYTDLESDEIALLFPGDLFVLLVGSLTFLRSRRATARSPGWWARPFGRWGAASRCSRGSFSWSPAPSPR